MRRCEGLRGSTPPLARKNKNGPCRSIFGWNDPLSIFWPHESDFLQTLRTFALFLSNLYLFVSIYPEYQCENSTAKGPAKGQITVGNLRTFADCRAADFEALHEAGLEWSVSWMERWRSIRSVRNSQRSSTGQSPASQRSISTMIGGSSIPDRLTP